MTYVFDSKQPLFIYGIGNVGRQDDGLGWAFIEALEDNPPSNVETFRNYQLNIEDAEIISHYSQVLFVDASKSESVETFRCRAVEPYASLSFTSHYLSMESVLALCQNVYNKTPVTHVIEIRGYAWELQQGLTNQAQQNLDMAVGFFKNRIKSAYADLS
ncbi:MAG: hydrogenase maturation protease [Gammaproteobacteria bacterium]|nr:hydrogenase maturation protease [Gammaproteobacteria bacterium]